MEKYWWYRYRLVNDFMKIGSDCGESLPAQRRNRARDYYSPDYDGRLKWADATIDLGNYIAMLATEHRILQNAGLSTRRSDMELKYALDAFDRLDRNAEAYCADIDATYPCNPDKVLPAFQNQLNGFFIRDDVPYLNFVPDNWTHFNRPGIKQLIPVNDWSCGAFMERYWEPITPGSPGGLRNEYGASSMSWGSREKRVPSEESQDQMVQLSMGMALAADVPGGVVYEGEDLRLQAGNALSRMIHHAELPDPVLGSRWLIKNPVTGKCVYGTSPANNCNAGGAEMYFFGGGVRATYEKYCGPKMMMKANVPAWQAQQFTWNTKDCNFAGTWAALTRDWYVGTQYFNANKNTTWGCLTKFAMAHDEGNPHLPYLYRVMFPGKGEWYRVEQTKQLLDAAPDCGIHNYNGTWSVQRNWKTGVIEHNPPKSHHWSGNDLIHEYQHRGSTSDNSDCNGLDFMTLFNLYAIQLGDYFPAGVFNAFYKENFKERFPKAAYTGMMMGDKDHKLKLNFLEYLSASNKLSADGYLAFRCGKVIDLIPGFETKPGANFEAYVQDYEIRCGHAGEGAGPAVADDAFHYADVTIQVGKAGSMTPVIVNSIFKQPLDGFVNDNGPAAGNGNSQDSTFFLDFPPDGSPYIPDEAAKIDGTEETGLPTCAEVRALVDSLTESIYATNDPDLIDYLNNELLPNIDLSECDNQQNGNYRIAASNSEAANFNVYPNPNNGNCTIAFDSKGDYSIAVYNSLGAVLYNAQVYDRLSESLQLNGLPPGIYTLVVSRNGTPQVQRKKISIVY